MKRYIKPAIILIASFAMIHFTGNFFFGACILFGAMAYDDMKGNFR